MSQISELLVLPISVFAVLSDCIYECLCMFAKRQKRQVSPWSIGEVNYVTVKGLPEILHACIYIQPHTATVPIFVPNRNEIYKYSLL